MKRSNYRMMNAMTIDVEDYYQVQALEQCVERGSWAVLPARVEANIDRILELFSSAGVTGTFFSLGWIAVRHPNMIQRIVREGHELASHGWNHVRADAQAPNEFLADIRQARLTLEDISGTQVLGYRAATFSVGKRNPWVYDALESAGYRYSSSVYPIRHDLYGMPDAPRTPFRPDGASVLEIPMSTVRIFGRNWPCAGGGYFRLLPKILYYAGLAHINQVEETPGIFYFHPWEIDRVQPRFGNCCWRSRVRHYTGLSETEHQLQELLRHFSWGRMDWVFANEIQHRKLYS